MHYAPIAADTSHHVMCCVAICDCAISDLEDLAYPHYPGFHVYVGDEVAEAAQSALTPRAYIYEPMMVMQPTTSSTPAPAGLAFSNLVMTDAGHVESASLSTKLMGMSLNGVSATWGITAMEVSLSVSQM